MKKLFALFLLVSSAAFAEPQYGVGLQYEYDDYTSNNARLQSVQKQGVVAGIRGDYGQLDTVIYNNLVKGDGFSDNTLGVEVGYGLGYTFANKLGINSRIAHGRLFGRGLRAPETTADYTTLAVGVGYPINDNLSLGVGYRRRFTGDLDGQNQYTAGGTYSFNKHYQLRVNYQHNVSSGRSTNGLATMLLYVF